MNIQDYFSIAALLPSMALAVAIVVGCVMYFAGAAYRGSRTLVQTLTGHVTGRTRTLARSFPPVAFNPVVPRVSHAMIGPSDR